MTRIMGLSASLLAIALGGFGCATPSAPAADAGWVTLLDGENGLDNFNRVGTGNWRAVDGAIQADARADRDGAFLLSKNIYTDFQIRVEFWASHDANSGIFLRCANVFAITDRLCYEANIFDQRPDPKYGTGAVVNFAEISPMPTAGGKWNTYDITVKGSRITLVLNGARTVDFEDKTLASGPIGLQYAGGTMRFRKVQIKAL